VEVTLANYCDDARAWRWVPADPGAPHARGRAGFIAVGLLRLFRHGRGFAYREAVHENITASVLERGGRILRAPDILIHHHGYDGDPVRTRAKAERYLAIARGKAAARPEDVKAQHDLAEQALACGLAEEAEAAARRAVALDPAHLAAVTTLANLLLNRGALDEARALLASLEAAGVSAPHVATALGAIALRQGRHEEARDRLEGVLAETPRAPMARLYLARLHDLEGASELAFRELALLRDMHPALPEFADLLRAHRLRGQAAQLLRAGFAPQALDCLVEALRLDPEDALVHNDLGVVLHQLGEAARARASLERARALAPGCAMIAENLAALGG
jgi:Flp pilus assembly protein TadD